MLYSRTSKKAQNWEAELTGWLQELKTHGSEMTPYEQNVVRRKIRRYQDELIPVVGAQVVGDFKNAIEGYKKAQARVQAERTKEIDRFDSGKLNNEIQLLQSRVKMAMDADKNPLRGDDGIAKRLEKLYSENVSSSDIHKNRAAVEVMKNISVNGPDRADVNDLARRAEAVEVEFRQTEGTRQAQQARIDALGELHSKHEELNRVSQLLGAGGVDDVFASSPFARAARMVEFTDDGPVIHDENSPEVTGVLWRNNGQN